MMGGQSFSSVLSKQSLSPSHFQDWGMQWPELSQVNCKKIYVRLVRIIIKFRSKSYGFISSFLL